ncbi:MAG: hypothetical protein ACP5NQ_02870 [Vulcanisaeta sp.]
MVQLATALVTTAYLVGASVVAYTLFSRFAWRGRASWVLIGIGFMLLSLALQVVVQAIPFLIIILTHIRDVLINASSATGVVLGFIRSNVYLVAIYMGLVAGISQEAFRYLAVRGRDFRSTLYIGYGFALIDIAFAIMSVVLQSLIPTPMGINTQYMAVVPVIGLVGLVIQPLVSFTFHPGASMIMRSYQAANKGFRGLLLMALAHAYMDSFVEYLNNALALGLMSPSFIIPISITYFVTVAAIPILIFIKGIRALVLASLV